MPWVAVSHISVAPLVAVGRVGNRRNEISKKIISLLLSLSLSSPPVSFLLLYNTGNYIIEYNILFSPFQLDASYF